MKLIRNIIAAWMLLSVLSHTALAQQDVYVNGYYRKDGTYVRPHYRSAPDSHKWNNYGPSRTSNELLNPRLRDYDRDGVPNYLDMDDDNDGRHDDSDRSQYHFLR